MAMSSDDRMSAKQAINHVWISGKGKLTDARTLNDFMSCWANAQSIKKVYKNIINKYSFLI